MIKVDSLRKTFDEFVAVSDISFSVKRGEVLGFLGPNGAGKSTAMKMITGFLTPSSGSVSVCGNDVSQSPLAVKTSIGYLPEGAPAYGDMTPHSFLEFIADIRGITGDLKEKSIQLAVEKTHIESVLHKSIETLSKGFKRRVGLAQAILHDPDVLILDEPTDGLDPNQKHEIRNLLKEMAKDKAIVISTHILEEVGAICSRAIIIARGKILFDGTPQELEALSPEKNAVQISINQDIAKDVAEKIRKLSGIEKIQSNDKGNGVVDVVAIPKEGQSIIKDISQLSREQKWEMQEMQVVPVQLDDVFRMVTTKDEVEGGVRT
ncbi:MAG: ABC transporter ATP-binding protein [Thiohalomonadales bacterium]